MAQSPFLVYWLRAAASSHGIALRSPDPLRLKSILYSARTKAPEHIRAGLLHLQLRTSPLDPKGELWLVPGAEATPA